MAAWLRKLLNVRSGEGRRTALLYALYFLMVMGSVWGESASEALFIDRVGLSSFSFLFIAEAVFTLVFTIVYTAFVDRVNNARLLAGILVVTGISLLITGLLLAPGLPIAFYLFYLIGRTTRVIFTVHIWTYIGEYYDTRAARRLFPLIGSAGRVSGFLGGMVFPFIVRTVHAENIPYLWAGVLVVSVWMCLSIPHWIGHAATSSTPSRTTGAIENFRGGWRTIRGSSLLKLLALGATTMTILLALINVQANYVFYQTFRSANELASLFGVLTGIANAIALPFQLFLLTRIVNRLGVGWTNLSYPVLTVTSYGLLTFIPLLPLAILGLFARTAFRWGVNNPVDNMLYNAVSRTVKGRARAFVNAMLVPLAMFLAGVMLLPVPRGGALPAYLFVLGGVIGLIYLIVAWRVRGAYRQELLQTLTVEDTDLRLMVGSSWDATDRAALGHVLARLDESSGEGNTLFLAELAYDIGGNDALPTLIELASNRGPIVRAGVLEIIGHDGLADPRVRGLCTDSLSDPNAIVRRTALAVLEEQSGPEDLPLLGLALDHLNDPDPDVRARAISLLLRSGDFYYLTTAAGALNGMLTSGDPSLRALAASVLGEMGDPRVVRTLAPHLDDPSEKVRSATAQAIAVVASATAPPWVRQITLESARKALADPAEAVRLAAVQVLARLNPEEVRPLLLEMLRDESTRVREGARQVLECAGTAAAEELGALLDSDDDRLRGAAVLTLLSLSTEKYREQADEEIRRALERTYQNLILIDALAPFAHRSAALAVDTLKERNRGLLEHVFRVLTAVHGQESVQVIQHNLRSADSHARANAVEALEALTSPTIARIVAPLVEMRGEGNVAEQEFGLQPLEAEAAVEKILSGQDTWLTAVVLYMIGEAGKSTLSMLDAPRLISRARRDGAIKSALSSPDALVAETARYVARQFRLLSADEKEAAMLSTIERVIFLKEVPFFSEMTISQIRALAGIAEEVSFEDDQVIFYEGEFGGTLYVIVSGKVAIEHKAESGTGSVARLATLETRQYFGESSIFDELPRSASAIAIGPTLLLSIRKEPLVSLVQGDPTLALELIRVLSLRLRQANEQIASRTKVRPRQLERLYDRLETDQSP